MNSKSKKILSLIIASNFAATTTLMNEQSVEAWSFWNLFGLHSQKEIDDVYNEAKNILNNCSTITKNINNVSKFNEFNNQLDSLNKNLKNNKSNYNNIVDCKNKLENLLTLTIEALDEQIIQIKNQEYAEKCKRERINAEVQQKLEEEKLQTQKDEQNRLDDYKALAYEKINTVLQSTVEKSVSSDIDKTKLKKLADETKAKIQSIENINNLDEIEALINKFLEETKSILEKEITLKEQQLNSELDTLRTDLQNKFVNLLQKVDSLDNTENQKLIKSKIDELQKLISSLSEMSSINDAQNLYENLNNIIDQMLADQAEKNKASEKHSDLKCLVPLNQNIDDVIGGNEQAVNSFKSIIEQNITNKSKKNRDDLVKNIIISGKSGNGKTLIVKTVTTSFDLPLYIVQGSKIISGPEGISLLQRTVESAKESGTCEKPAVILIEKIDESHSNLNNNKTLIDLMNILNNIDNKNNVITVFTCKDSSNVDTIVTKLNKKVEKILVTLPNCDDRIKIFNIYLKLNHITTAPGVNLDQISNLMDNFTGDEIKQVVENAVFHVNMQKNVEKVINSNDINYGIQKVLQDKKASD